MAMAMLLALPAHACTKTVRWFDDAPYSFRAPNGKIDGFDVELTREVLRRVGCQAVFVDMPWARALVQLQSGRLDILPGTFRNERREAFAYFSIPSLQSRNVLYIGPKAEASYRLSRLDDMLGTTFRLGVQIGVSYGDKYDALQADPRFSSNQVPVTFRRRAWKMMEMGRIDGMIADEASAALELHQLGLSHMLKPSAVVVSTNTSRIAFSKRSVSPQLVGSFNRALESMIADGQYRKIRMRYLRCPTDIKVLGCA